jgi:hypothetical protein
MWFVSKTHRLSTMFWQLVLLTEAALFLDFADAALSVCDVQASFLETARVQRLLATPNHPSAATLTDAFKQPAALLAAALRQRAGYLSSALTGLLDRDQTSATARTLDSLSELIAKLDKLEQKNVTPQAASPSPTFWPLLAETALFVGSADAALSSQPPAASPAAIRLRARALQSALTDALNSLLAPSCGTMNTTAWNELDHDQINATREELTSLSELIAKLDKLEQNNVTDEWTSIETVTDEGFDQQAGVIFLYIGDDDLEDGGETPEAEITPIN